MNEQALGKSKDGYQKRGEWWSYRISVRDSITNQMKQVRFSGFRTKEEAKADRIRRESESREGKYVSKSNETVKDLFDSWFQHRQDLREAKLATLNSNGQMLKYYIIPKLGNLPIQELTTEILEEFLRDLVKGGGFNNRRLSHGTLRQVKNVLNMGLNYAVKRKKLSFNPLVNVRKIKGRKKLIIAYSTQEIKRLLERLSIHRLYAFFVIACHTGARKGEICALRWSDLDFENKTLSIHKTRGKTNGKDYEEDSTKNERGMRVIYLNSEPLEVLKAHKERQNLERMLFSTAWKDTGYIFTREDGSPVDTVYPYSVFKQAIKDLNLRNEPLHVLRHTHTTELLRSGVSPHIVAQRIGDKVETILKTYASVVGADDQKSADIFAESVRRG
jgi:integrase